MTPHQCRPGLPPCCPLWPHQVSDPRPRRRLPEAGWWVLGASGLYIGLHILAAVLGLAPAAVMYAAGWMLGVLLAVAATIALAYQLTRR